MWCVVYVIWHMVYTTWHIVYGIWYMLHSMWYMVDGMSYMGAEPLLTARLLRSPRDSGLPVLRLEEVGDDKAVRGTQGHYG